jgi:hypothetical protein
LFPRFNSTLFQGNHKARHKARRYNYKARRFVREHTGMSVAVAAAVTGIGVASAVVGSAPWAGAAATVATAHYIGPGTPAGQTGGTIIRSVFGVHPESDDDQGAAAFQPWEPAEPAQQQPVQQQPVQQQPVQQQAPPKPQTPSQPFTFYDSVLPSVVPPGQPIATYSTGPFAVSPYQVAGHSKVLWIDTNGSSPQTAGALDVEPGDATPSIAAQWVQQRLTAKPTATAIIYTTLGEWSLVQAAIGTLPSSMQSHVKYWIADPNGIPHMVPGASATQWSWSGTYDTNTAAPGFF